MSKEKECKRVFYKRIISTMLVLLLVFSTMTACTNREETFVTETLSQEEELPGEITDVEEDAILQNDIFNLGEGLQIIKAGKYAGLYLEDGSDDPVTNLQMIVLHNTSAQDLQYGKINLTYDDGVAEFCVTNLPAGQQVILLEQKRMNYHEQMPSEVAVENVVFTQEMPLYEEVFEISALDGALNVRNISDKDISGEVFVYYKNFISDMYYGGITYRVRLEGGMKAGEIRQIMSDHFDPEGSDILMVTYTE